MFWSQLLFCGMCILVLEDPTSPPFYIGRDEHTSAFSWSQASATALSAIPHVLSSSGGGGKSYRPFSHQLVAIAMLLLRLYNRETNLSGFFVVSPTLLFFSSPCPVLMTAAGPLRCCCLFFQLMLYVPLLTTHWLLLLHSFIYFLTMPLSYFSSQLTLKYFLLSHIPFLFFFCA